MVVPDCLIALFRDVVSSYDIIGYRGPRQTCLCRQRVRVPAGKLVSGYKCPGICFRTSPRVNTCLVRKALPRCLAKVEYCTCLG